MTISRKTDNAYLRSKLELRRYFLRKYHADEPPRVLDCCQGSGKLWGILGSEFSLESYWGMDLKPKKGRLQIDSVRVLMQDGWQADVLDVDTYGSPWKHWEALLATCRPPLTVFLTIGMVKMSGGNLDRIAAKAMGIRFQRLKPPNSILAKLHALSVSYCLQRTCTYDILTSEVMEATPNGRARYLGVRLEARS